MTYINASKLSTSSLKANVDLLAKFVSQSAIARCLATLRYATERGVHRHDIRDNIRAGYTASTARTAKLAATLREVCH